MLCVRTRVYVVFDTQNAVKEEHYQAEGVGGMFPPVSKRKLSQNIDKVSQIFDFVSQNNKKLS